jgi:hypothetical protein
MMKRGLQPPPGSVGLLTCPTCCTDGTITNTPKPSLPWSLSSNASIPDLIDQCNLSSSSSESNQTSVLLSNDDKFEISEFQNFEIPDSSIIAITNHNFDSGQFFKMESDCEDKKPPTIGNDGSDTSNQDNIMTMLSMISDRMMSSIQDMQRQLVQTDLKFSTALEKITEENDRFKQEIRNEVQLLHQPASNTSTSVTNSVNPTLNISSTHSPPSVPTSVASQPVSTVDPQDLQTQMMALLTTTFSKLTTVMAENKSTETKSDWPKFGGDTKKFKHWYLAIVAQLSLTPWKEFYDSSTNSILPVTTNTTLNEKLYAKLLLCLEGQVFQDMISRKHLRGNGLLLLSELSQTYRPSHVPEVTAAKTVEFWSTLKRLPYESVDAFYNRFQALLDDLEDAGEPIPVQSAIRQFLFTLGPDFAPIQNNHRIGLLPDAWKTTDWPTLLILCRDYANSVRPQGSTKQDKSDFATNPNLDRSAHHKKVKQ